MRIVIADAIPIHYLVLIGHSEVLPVLFERVIIPTAVRDELTSTGAPEPVRAWIKDPPVWLEIHPHAMNRSIIRWKTSMTEKGQPWSWRRPWVPI